MKITIHEVELPIEATPDFITPYFEILANFYPRYAAAAVVNQHPPLSFAGYLYWICKELERSGCREGRSAEVWFARIMEHFGVVWFMNFLEKYRGLRGN